MGVEIDRIEIDISANSKSASENVLALADSLDRLQGSAAGVRNPLNHAADGLASLKDAAKNAKNMEQTVADIQRGLDALSHLEPPTGLQKLADAIKPLNEVSQTLSALSSNSNIKNTAKNLADLSFGLTGLSNIRVDGVENVKAFFEGLNSIRVDPELAKTVNQFGSAVKKITEISPNENAADSLRLFIDTVRIITDDDIEKLRALSDAASGLTNINLPNQNNENHSDNTPERIREIGDEASEAEPKISRFREALGGIAKTSASVAGGALKAVAYPLTAVGKTFASAASKAGEFLGSLKRIALYRAVRTVLKAISQGFQEGRENLYQYSLLAGTDFAKSMDRAATASLYLKNSIGAATAPLTNYLVPVLDRVIDRAVELINRFNEMTAVLTGASTWTKAVKYPTQWQDAVDDADSAAKKLKSTLLGFDELNVIEPKTTGSASSGLTADDYSKMFEEVATDIKLDNAIPDILIPVKMAWDAEGDNTLREIRETWESILGLIGSVGESVRTVWSNGTGQQTLETILQIVQEIVGTFGALTKGIKRAWDEGGKGTRIIQGVWNVANNVLTVFRDIWASIREWAEGLDWNPLLASFGDLFDAIDRITNPESGLAKLLKSLFEDILEPIGKWTIEEGVPAAVDLLTGAFDALGAALDIVEPVLSKVAEWIGNMAGYTFSNISGLASGLGAVLSIVSGNEASDYSAANLEKSNQKLKYFFDWDKNGSSFWYDPANDALQDLGESIYDIFHKEDISETLAGIDYESKLAESGGYGGGGGHWDDPASETLAGIDYESKLAESGGYGGGGGHWDDPASETLAGIDYESELSKMESFKQSWESVWTDIKQFFVDIWTGIRDWFQEKIDWWAGFWEYLDGCLSDWKNSWKSCLETIKTTAKKAWDTVVGWLSDKWQSLKQKITDYADAWNSRWNDIKSFVSDAWDAITGWVTDNLTWSGMKSNITDFSQHFSEKFEDIKQDVHKKFDEIKGKITGLFENVEIFQKAGSFVTKITGVIGNIWDNGAGGGIKGKLNNIKNGFVDIFNGIKNSIKNPINEVISNIEGLVNAGIAGLNGLIDRIQFIKNNSNAVAAFERYTGISLDWTMELYPIELPRLATGGIVDKGQLFIANEAGPELVGRFGSQTGVMNNKQITNAVSEAVYRAMMQAMSQQNGTSARPIQNNIYLDGKELTSQVNRQEKANGVSIFGEVVYT